MALGYQLLDKVWLTELEMAGANQWNSNEDIFVNDISRHCKIATVWEKMEELRVIVFRGDYLPQRCIKRWKGVLLYSIMYTFCPFLKDFLLILFILFLAFFLLSRNGFKCNLFKGFLGVFKVKFSVLFCCYLLDLVEEGSSLNHVTQKNTPI